MDRGIYGIYKFVIANGRATRRIQEIKVEENVLLLS
jgi:hypothetical protein